MFDLKLMRKQAKRVRRTAIRDDDQVRRSHFMLYANEYDLTADLVERRIKSDPDWTKFAPERRKTKARDGVAVPQIRTESVD